MGNEPWRPEGLTPPTADSDVKGMSPEEIYFMGVDDAIKLAKEKLETLAFLLDDEKGGK